MHIQHSLLSFLASFGPSSDFPNTTKTTQMFHQEQELPLGVSISSLLYTKSSKLMLSLKGKGKLETHRSSDVSTASLLWDDESDDELSTLMSRVSKRVEGKKNV